MWFKVEDEFISFKDVQLIMTEKPLFKTPRTRGHARSRGNIFETFKTII